MFKLGLYFRKSFVCTGLMGLKSEGIVFFRQEKSPFSFERTGAVTSQSHVEIREMKHIPN